jgi:carboxypeptidase family protein
MAIFGLRSPCSPNEVSSSNHRRLAFRLPDEVIGNLAGQQPTPAPAVGGTLTNVRGLLGRVPRLNVKLSTFQTVVGLTAGFVSILGALLAVPNYFRPAIGKGEVVAVVVDAKTEKAVSSATVEILTLNNAVVTTMNSGLFGKASSTLEEGQYRIRVKHPKFGAEVRHVQVVSGQTAEIRVQLHSGPSVPLNEAVNAVKRLFGN